MDQLLALVAAASLAASTPVLAECTAADRAALQAFDATWTKASIAGDRAALTTLISDNFGNMNLVDGGSKAGMIENSVRNAPRLAANPPQSTQDHFMFICSTNMATIMHRNVEPAVAPAASPTYSRTMHVLEKTGNSWQVVTSLSNPLTDQQTLLYMELDWTDAVKGRDASWLEKHYASDARDVSGSGVIRTKAEEIENMEKSAETYESLELSNLNIRIEGDAGVVTGINTVKGKDAQGKPMAAKYAFTDTFIRRNGQWMVWSTQGTMVK